MRQGRAEARPCKRRKSAGARGSALCSGFREARTGLQLQGGECGCKDNSEAQDSVTRNRQEKASARLCEIERM